MTLNFIAAIGPFPVGMVCFFLSIRAFYLYALSRSDTIIIIALAMISIAISLCLGALGDSHIIHFNTGWLRYIGSAYGILFIFLCSLMKSHEQILRLKNWQMIGTGVFILLILLTPVLPIFTTPLEPVFLNACRMLITAGVLCRYMYLYSTKRTRFSMIMSIGFLLLLIGYGVVVFYILAPVTFAVLYLIGAFVVSAGYSSLLLAYSVG